MANRFKKLLGGGSGAGVTGLTSAANGTAIADNAIIRGEGTSGIQGSLLYASDAGLLGLGSLSSSDSGIKDSTDRNGSIVVRAVRADDGLNVGLVSRSLQLGGEDPASTTDHKIFYDAGRDELTLSSTQMLGWGPASTNPFANADFSFTRVAPGVVSANAGRTTAQSGWIQTGGFKRKTADQTVTNSTTLVDDSHLTVTLAAGRSYGFKFILFATEVATSGLKVALAGTATHTNIIADVMYLPLGDPTSPQITRLTAVGTGFNATSGWTDSRVVIEGTTTVNAAGTFLVQFAQNAETGAAETATLRRGSTLEVWDIQ